MTQLNVHGANLASSTFFNWISSGVNGSLTLFAVGTDAGFANYTQLVIELTEASITLANGRLQPINLTENHNPILVTPSLSGNLLKYQASLTSFKEEIPALNSSSANPAQISLFGQASVNFVWLDVVQEEADTEFFQVSLSCDCNSQDVLGLDIMNENVRLTTVLIGNMNPEMIERTPNAFRTEYSFVPNQITPVYVEWETIIPPPWFSTQPYDWIISGIVGAAISGVSGFVVGYFYDRLRIKHTAPPQTS